MTGVVRNIPTESGYDSIVHDVKIGSFLEIFIDESTDEEGTPKGKFITEKSICGYVAGIYIGTKNGEPEGSIINLSPSNPLALLKEDCPVERKEDVFPIGTKYISHYRIIDPAN